MSRISFFKGGYCAVMSPPVHAGAASPGAATDALLRREEDRDEEEAEERFCQQNSDRKFFQGFIRLPYACLRTISLCFDELAWL